MATGASNAELAVLLVDARKGLTDQTRRHAMIASLLGIRHVVLAVNKIDLVDFERAAFDAIAAEFQSFAAALGFQADRGDPDLGALRRQCFVERSARTPWYAGPPLAGIPGNGRRRG